MIDEWQNGMQLHHHRTCGAQVLCAPKGDWLEFAGVLNWR